MEFATERMKRLRWGDWIRCRPNEEMAKRGNGIRRQTNEEMAVWVDGIYQRQNKGMSSFMMEHWNLPPNE